ncbi:hypothetical protein OG453_24675 [Streptomyces sp. NBC_01381]|uniref:hypothetical protein n=1 Tax=Streptomyces sp. NBC_01381 TaxID=2903845 RepID=UPI00225A13E3|nr:hypothetical protein [Streptomyces sp. NBC_01381]MCX4669840.1 hypothetical protein [Streptomyces sp. NBC_01381]
MRGRGAGCAAVLLMVLTGCGDDGGTADAKATSTPKPTTAPGVDGEVDAGKVFTDAELKAALLPAKAVGKKARASEATLGFFDLHRGGGDWGTCEPATKLLGELRRMQGASAGHTLRPLPGPVSDGDPFVSESLISMPAEQASRYLDLRRQLHDGCPVVTVDTEAAPVDEHHQAWKWPDMGDEAVLETLRYTGGDEYDGTPYYTIEMRVGGVLVLVDGGTDKALTISSAAKAAERVRRELYKAS